MDDTAAAAATNRDVGGPLHVEVAVTLLKRGPLLLAGWNRNWDAYTLPMTKRRHISDAEGRPSPDAEPWADAARRNVTEWLASSEIPPLAPLMVVQGYRQSDRDLVVKEYHFEVFAANVNGEVPLRPGIITEWLRLDEFREVHRRPISPTARYLIQMLENSGKLQ
jgi:hypothetical protein